MKPILHIPLFTILFSACLFITGLSTIKAEAESEEKDCSWGSTFIDYHNFPDTICSETVQFDVIHGYLDPGNPNDYYLECAKSTYLQIYDAASTLWITLDSGTSGANTTWPDTINFNVTSEIATFLGDSFYCGRYYTFKYIVGTLNITFPNDTIHIIDSIYFDCGSSLDLNASIFTDPSIFPSCDPVLIYTSRNGNPTTHFNWTHGSLPGTFFSNNESITVADQNITNINVTLIDSSFGGQCDIGFDTLQTTIDYKGFEITISSNSNTTLNCSDPTNQLSFPDLYYADSALHNFSYQWFKRENGISIAIVGETNARLREVDQEGQYAVRATNSSTGCSDVSNYITISGISEEFYSLSIDGGNQLCLGENSPELNFTPPLPYPFPSSATMTVYDDGVSQAASTTINSEGYFCGN